MTSPAAVRARATRRTLLRIALTTLLLWASCLLPGVTAGSGSLANRAVGVIVIGVVLGFLGSAISLRSVGATDLFVWTDLLPLLGFAVLFVAAFNGVALVLVSVLGHVVGLGFRVDGIASAALVAVVIGVVLGLVDIVRTIAPVARRGDWRPPRLSPEDRYVLVAVDALLGWSLDGVAVIDLAVGAEAVHVRFWTDRTADLLGRIETLDAATAGRDAERVRTTVVAFEHGCAAQLGPSDRPVTTEIVTDQRWQGSDIHERRLIHRSRSAR